MIITNYQIFRTAYAGPLNPQPKILSANMELTIKKLVAR